MRDADIKAKCLEWFKTGQLRGLHRGMTEAECIGLLGNPEDSNLDEVTRYGYPPFELYFSDRVWRNGQGTQFSPNHALVRIAIERPGFLSRLFRQKRGLQGIRPIELRDFLNYHGIEHRSFPAFPKEGRESYFWQPRQIRTSSNIDFYFSYTMGGDLALDSIEQDLLRDDPKKQDYNILFFVHDDASPERPDLPSLFNPALPLQVQSGRHLKVHLYATHSEAIQQAQKIAAEWQEKNGRSGVQWVIL